MEEYTDNVCDLLEYVGLAESDLEVVYNKIHFWSFVASLAEQLEERGFLSIKQQTALVNLITKHTGCVCLGTKITHNTEYKRKGNKGHTVGERVEHSFSSLETIQLFDLPYVSGSTYTDDFHPYNQHSIVVKVRDIWYKIPKPEKWPLFKESTTVKFEYKRTACKGYMSIVQS